MEALLTMLKVDLGITTTAYDARLVQYLLSAQAAMTREGINVDLTSSEDGQIMVMYAAWMWRRRDSMEAMPRMLRYQLNNRLFAQKAGGV
jgi:hypothetical protein